MCLTLEGKRNMRECVSTRMSFPVIRLDNTSVLALNTPPPPPISQASAWTIHARWRRLPSRLFHHISQLFRANQHFAPKNSRNEGSKLISCCYSCQQVSSRVWASGWYIRWVCQLPAIEVLLMWWCKRALTSQRASDAHLLRHPPSSESMLRKHSTFLCARSGNMTISSIRWSLDLHLVTFQFQHQPRLPLPFTPGTTSRAYFRGGPLLHMVGSPHPLNF